MAKTNESDSESSGVLDTLDKVCRWIVPGYNYLCNRLFGMRDHLDEHEVSSEMIYLNNGRNGAEITDEIYEGAGISKSEFCQILEELIRKKVIEMRRRMSQVDQDAQDNDVGVLDESDQSPTENRNTATQEESDQSQVVPLENESQNPSQVLHPKVNPGVQQKMMLAMGHKTGRKTERSTDSSTERPRKKARLEEESGEQENTEAEIEVPSEDTEMEEKQLEEPEPEPETQPDLDYVRKFPN